MTVQELIEKSIITAATRFEDKSLFERSGGAKIMRIGSLSTLQGNDARLASTIFTTAMMCGDWHGDISCFDEFVGSNVLFVDTYKSVTDTEAVGRRMMSVMPVISEHTFVATMNVGNMPTNVRFEAVIDKLDRRSSTNTKLVIIDNAVQLIDNAMQPTDKVTQLCRMAETYGVHVLCLMDNETANSDLGFDIRCKADENMVVANLLHKYQLIWEGVRDYASIDPIDFCVRKDWILSKD